MMIAVRVVLLLCVLFMLAFGIFCVVEMVNFPHYSYDDDIDPREKYHWFIAIASCIAHFLMGCVLLASAIILPGWWRKGLALWGIFTCFVMFMAGFFLSGK